MKRILRLTKIVFKLKYGLLKSVHRKIVINSLYNKMLCRIDLSTPITPKEFNDVMNKCQVDLLESLSSNGR